jgi:hypothetical protein
MRTPRRITTVAVLVLLVGAACGGGGSSTDAADDDTGDGGAKSSETTTTADEDEETTTTAAAKPVRTDIKPCELLTADELEAQASVAKVASFEVTSQEATGPDGRGAFRCNHYFNVKDEGSEITATLAVEIRPKDAASEYRKLHDFGERDRQDVANLGDKAFYDVENGSITILDDDLVVIIDPGMPGVMEETNRPVAEAVAPIVLGRL